MVTLLLGEGAIDAPIHAMALNKIANVGRRWAANLSGPNGTSSKEIFQNSGHETPPFIAPQNEMKIEIATIAGNVETKLWLHPHKLGYLLPAKALTCP